MMLYLSVAVITHGCITTYRLYFFMFIEREPGARKPLQLVGSHVWLLRGLEALARSAALIEAFPGL